MMLAWMAVSLVAAAVLCLSGVLVEWASLAYRRAVRWIWLAVLLASALFAIGGPVILRAPSRTGNGSVPGAPAAGVATGLTDGVRARLATAVDDIADAGHGLDAMLTLVWLISSIACGTSLVLAHRKLRRERRTWMRTVLDGDDVLVSEELGPAVVGFRSPQIVVPAWTLDMDAESQRLIACHEREHLRAGDQRLVMLAVFAMSMAPWNPLLWWQLRRLRLAIEIDCDRRALRSGAGMRQYGNLLINLGERISRMPALAAPLAERGSALVRRVRAITRSAPRARAVRAMGAMAGASVLAGFVVFLPAPIRTPGVQPPSGSGRVASFMSRAVPAGTLRPMERDPRAGVGGRIQKGRFAFPTVPGRSELRASPSPSPSPAGGVLIARERGREQEGGAYGVVTRTRPDSTTPRPASGTLREVRATAVRSHDDTLRPRRPE